MANKIDNNYALILLINGIFLLISSTFISAFPPQNPVQCNSTGCILHNSYGVWGDRKDCYVAGGVVYPTTEEELRQAVATANKKSLKVKVVTKFSHTIPKLACPTSTITSTTYDPNAILISTEKYSSNVNVDAANKVVTADSGVPLRTLIDRVEEEALSLVAAPYWEGVTVGGVISTGAHGSSWWGLGGAVHDHVVGVRLVVPAAASEGYAKIVNLRAGQDPHFNAAIISVGTLGVISKVTLSLESAFKRSITFNYTSDDDIENQVFDHAKKYEFADIQWYPSRNMAVYRYDNRVPLNTSGDGVNDFIGFQSNSILISKSVRASEKALEASGNAAGKCPLAGTAIAYKRLTGNGLKNNLIFTGYPVVGRHGKMQTSGSCLYSSSIRIDESCGWDPRINGLFFYESTAIFPAIKFLDFLRNVKKLRDLKNPENFCGVDLYNGFLVRFIKASKAYLGQSEDSVVVDFNYYRADDPLTPRLNQDVWEEVEQMAFFKFGAKPHWAKNRNVAFLDVAKKYPNFSKFMAAKKELDPQNMFSSDWSDQILFGKPQAVKNDGCALEGQCVCSEDRHCSPAKGYFCQSGLVYTQARVCRHSTTTTTSSRVELI